AIITRLRASGALARSPSLGAAAGRTSASTFPITSAAPMASTRNTKSSVVMKLSAANRSDNLLGGNIGCRPHRQNQQPSTDDHRSTDQRCDSRRLREEQPTAQDHAGRLQVPEDADMGGRHLPERFEVQPGSK